MGKYFGTDGFRGEANKDLTFEHAVKIGRYLGWYYGAREGKKAKIVIGKDTRRSSYMFEYALCTGLMASGADAYIMHRLSQARPLCVRCASKALPKTLAGIPQRLTRFLS